MNKLLELERKIENHLSPEKRLSAREKAEFLMKHDFSREAVEKINGGR